MKLLELNLKNFGKFHNKKLAFGDGIQLIYGENESGKSTIHTFIRSMLFGMERGRGRAAGSDEFSKYEPWENGNYYSGEMKIECEEKVFCLQRNFDKYSKSASLICETDGEVLSVHHQMTRGSKGRQDQESDDLGILLDGLTAASYENTLCIGQLLAGTNQELSDELKNYAMNYYVTGDSDIDFTSAKESLLQKKKKLEKESKGLLEEKQKKREEIAHESSYIWRDMMHMDAEIDSLKKEYQRMEEKESDQDHAWQEVRKQRVTDMIRPKKWRIHPIEIIAIILIDILSFYFLPNPWKAYVTVPIVIAGIIYIWNRMKVSKAEAGKSAGKEDGSDEEESSREQIYWEYEKLLKMRMEKQIEYDNLQEKIRELDEMNPDYLETERKVQAVALALNRLEEVSKSMQTQLAAKLNQRVSEIVSVITDGKYDRLTVDETLQMHIYHEGRMISLNQVSRGTLEQIYFALRITAAEILYQEEYPIILDDTFAFYDEDRLRNTLRWLSDSGKQVLLFTCHKREAQIMNEMGIPYDRISLSND
ncbi:MAG: AAA family ATPase [Eubacteriales bacterium]|nr:AAA family ATPase [Eubacteriales bacterium]